MTAIDWTSVRAAYEQRPDRLKDIAARFGIDPRNLRRRAAAEGWVRSPSARRYGPAPGRRRTGRAEAAGLVASGRTAPASRRSGAPDLEALVASLRRTTGRLVRAAEQRYAAGDADGIDEKDLRTLTALAGMLAKVIALETRSPRDDDPAPHAAGLDVDDPRQRDAFSERLERFAASLAAGAERGDDGLGTGEARDLLAALRAS